MKKNLLFLSVTAVLISACGGGVPPVPVTLASVTLGGVGSTLQISVPAKLNVTATGTDGAPFMAAQSFTSSDPSVVSVGTDGTLNVRHLSVKPVVLTVAEGDKTASVTVTTYGLDGAGGTYVYQGSGKAPGTQFAVQFRDSQGNSFADGTQVTVTGPSAFNGGAPYTATFPKGLPVTVLARLVELDKPAVSGQYTATLLNAGVTYSKTFSVDASQLQPFASGLVLTATNAGYTVTGGALPGNSPLVFGVLYSGNGVTVASTDAIKQVPATGTFAPAVPSGVYNTGFYAQSYISGAGVVIPEQINRSFVFTGTVTVP